MRDPLRAGWFPRGLRLPALLMLGFCLVPAGEAQMYVTNVGTGSGTVTSYPTSSSGNASPSTTITDTANLKTPQSIAVNGTSIFVGTINNVGSGQITVYPLTASGTSPTVTATITDSVNGLSPWGLAVDANYIYVGNQAAGATPNSIAIYSLSASGNATPVAVIAGSNTGLSSPSGVAVDANNIYVANGGSGTITVYPLMTNGSVTTGNMSPARTITGLTGASGLAVTATSLFVINQSTPSIAVYALNASGAATPTATITGSSTTLSANATGLAVDANNIYVAQGTDNLINIFPLAATGNVAPTTIAGSNTGLNGVSAIAVLASSSSGPTTPTVTVAVGTYIYNGSPQGPQTSDVSAGGSTGAITLSYAGTGSTMYAASSIPPTGAGTYTVTASVAATSSYAAASSSATPFTIAQGISTIVVSGSSAFVYTGSTQGPATIMETGSTGTQSLSYVGIGATTYGPSAMPPSAVGTYAVTASVSADANYLAATSPPFPFIIGPAALPTPTVTVNAGTYTYNGSPQGPQTSDVNAGGSTGAITLSYAGTGSTTYAASATPPTGAGTYTVTASVAATYSYAAGSSSATPFTIAQKSPTISFSGSSTFTYSGSPQGPSASAFTPEGSTGAITLSYAGTGSTTYAASAMPPTAVGTYTVTASVAADANYLAATSTAFSFSIALPTPTVSVKVGTSTFYTYNGSPQGPQASDFSTGGSTGAITLSYAGTGSTTYAASTPPTGAGTYTVTASVAATSSYSAGSSSATSFTIAKATPIISFVGSSTYTYNGSAQGPQTSDFITGGSTGAISLSYFPTGLPPGTRPIATGTYTARASVTADSNYEAGFLSVNFTIAPATPIISVGGSSTYTYNGSPQGPQTSDVKTGGSTSAPTLMYAGTATDGTTYGPSHTAPTNPGSYTVTASVVTDGNYLAATSAPFAFTITQPPPTITAVHFSAADVDGATGVTITGTGFFSPIRAVFVSGGVTTALYNYITTSTTSIGGYLPSALDGQTGSFIVTTDGGSSSPFPYAPPPPAVTSIAPAAGPAAGGTPVVVTGTGFTGATGVKIGDTVLPSSSFKVVNDSAINLNTPKSILDDLVVELNGDTVDITVTTPGGTSVPTHADQFTYMHPPTVTSVQPDNGDIGTQVTLAGYLFTGATRVMFGGSSLPSSRFKVVNDSAITFTVMDSDLLSSSDGQGLIYRITVTTPSGESSDPGHDTFTYSPGGYHAQVVSISSPVSGSGAAPSARVAASLGPVAVSLSGDGSIGKMVGYIAGLAQGFACSFAPDAQGNFSVTTATVGGTGGPTTLTIAGTATPAAGISCTIQPLGLSYQGSFDTQYGPTSSLSGSYVALASDGGAGTSYTVVDNHGNVFVMEVAAGSVAAGVGTLDAATASFTVPLSSGTASGAINPASLAFNVAVTSNGATLSFLGATSRPVPATALINLSTLGAVTPAMPLTVGFVIDGPSSKQVVLRGVGPGLSGFGVSGVLAAPVLTLYNSSGAVLATNSGWGGTAALTAAFSSVGAFALSPSSLDAALQTTLPPGAYTVVISDTAKDARGNALAEIYDASPDLTETTQSLINVSSLGNVAPAGTITAGFSIRGNSAKTVLIRAVGPGLIPFGVANTLVDPTLTVFDSSGNLQAQNNDWGTPSAINSTQTPASAAAIASAEATCGAFALATGSKDSAVVVTLNPGNYTAVASSVGSASGTALVEVYELP